MAFSFCVPCRKYTHTIQTSKYFQLHLIPDLIGIESCMTEIITEWQNCYRDSWRGLLCESSFAHQGKIARGLIRQICEHAIQSGWVSQGDAVYDPFAGVGGTAYYPANSGLQWFGMELEEPFYEAAKENIALWKHMARHDKAFCVPTVWHRDSRLSVFGGQSIQLVISSPPYENSINSGKSGFDWEKANEAKADGRPRKSLKSPARDHEYRYGKTTGQIGSMKGQVFWESVREVIDKCYRSLQDGGHAIWVVKDYVRGGKLISFCDQWKQVCESVGFRTVCEHRAMMTKTIEEANLFSGVVNRKIEHKSFFRRQVEKKGAPPVDWEMVICQQKT